MERRVGYRESRRALVVGLSIVFGIFIVEAIIDSVVSSSVIDRARGVQERSIASLEKLSRIVRSLDQERILLDDHTYEERAQAMAGIEKQLADIAGDFGAAAAAYAPLIDQPNEAELWRDVQATLARYRSGVARTLELSRELKNAEARAQMRGVRDSYAELNRKLFELNEVNQRGATQSTAQVQAMMRSTDQVVWGVRGAGLLALAVLGWWLLRRISLYEAQINAHTRELEERNRDLDAFAGRVAHDLKNALEPVVMAPALLRRAQANPSRVLEVADRTERCSMRANAVLDSLLAFSRASRKVEDDEAADVGDVMKDVVDEVSPRAAELDVAMEVDRVPELRVRCNPGLLQIVLANLCGNAVKYLGGQPQRRVRVSARREGASCRIEIEDTGPGIPLAVQQKIFEPFFRVEGTRAPGTGIGLATVRRIVDGRGGRVTVESTEGRGARFSVWLPLVPTPEDRRAKSVPSSATLARH